MVESSVSEQAIEAVYQLANTCLEDLDHTRHVTFLALNLFDDLGSLHHLKTADRFWLECAAMLHDIGLVNGPQSHHKESLHMILESQILPFDHKERLIIGSIARYHRKALPSLAHDHYRALEPAEREKVSLLAALLRIADGLDYSHMNRVLRVNCEVTPQKVKIYCLTNHPAKEEFAQAEKKADLFRLVYSKEPVWIENRGNA